MTHAALFGSLARGEARPGSDIDIMIEFDPRAEVDVFEYAGIKIILRACSTHQSMSLIAMH